MIVQPHGMIQGKRPQGLIELVRPVHCRVLHHGASLLRHGANRSFSLTILMFGANATEVDLLTPGLDIFHELLGLEDTIV
jgi:hypothetical protein